MNKKDLEFFRQMLLEQRRLLTGQIEDVTTSETNITSRDESGDHSAYAFHMADQGTDNMEREKRFFYAQRDNQSLQDITDALNRIETGDYGKCIECDDEIHIERLKVVPHAMLCVKCQSEAEKQSRFNPFSSGEAV